MNLSVLLTRLYRLKDLSLYAINYLTALVSGYECHAKPLGVNVSFQCPRPVLDSSDKEFCCGRADDVLGQQCCDAKAYLAEKYALKNFISNYVTEFSKNKNVYIY